VIAWAPTRQEAAQRLAATLRAARLHGVVTNRDLLVRVLTEPEFLAGGTDTAYLERHREVFEPLVDDPAGHALAAALGAATARRREQPWGALPAGWRNIPTGPQWTEYDRGEVRYRLDRSGVLVEPAGVRLVSADPERVVLEQGGLTRTYHLHAVDDVTYVDSSDGAVTLTALPRYPVPRPERAAGSLLAPMPGTVGRVSVHIGQVVDRGDLLLTLEAMKLEHPVHAPEAGVVTDLPVQPGAQVDTGALLAVITPATAAEGE
jgi:propionyl-CoA carboxylase alpha chain